MYAEEDYLMISGIQHFVFCRRQWALIHIEQQWEENYKTTAGELMHKRAHNDSSFEKRGDLLITRGLRIASRELGITGQCDVVEFHMAEEGINVFGYDGTWNPVPIEYKNGEPKDGKEDELQLCAQAVCLEEMFQKNVLKGYLYYGKNRRRTEVIFDASLREELEKMCEEMHQLYKRGYTPKVRSTPKCRSCSLQNICLPKLQKIQSVEKYIDSYVKEESQEI